MNEEGIETEADDDSLLGAVERVAFRAIVFGGSEWGTATTPGMLCTPAIAEPFGNSGVSSAERLGH